jgi:cephalosporin-C deacetylase
MIRIFSRWLYWAALFFSGVAVAFPQAVATNSDYVLSVALDRPDAMYHRGETVTYTIKLLHDDKPASDAEVNWMISKDGVAPSTKGAIKLTNGTATLTGTLDEPGFLQCRVKLQTGDKDALTAYGGAAFDPLQIKPSLPVPDDFDEFWAAQKKKLAAIPVNARFTAVSSNSNKGVAFDVQADCLGAPVSAYLARPPGSNTHSLPILLSVHGAGVVSSQLGSAQGWARQGFLAMDMNAHGLPNGKTNTYYSDLFAGDLKDYYYRGRESREESYFLGMFLRLVRALDVLTAQPEWDGRTVVVYGISQGGAQALAAAGLDPRVTLFAAGVPGMCDRTGSVVGRIGGWPKLVGKGKDGPPEPNVLEAARYYDAMNFVRRTHAAAIFTVGFIDTVCPPTTVYAAYNALSGKKQIFNDPLSPHAVLKPATEAMRKAVLEHVREMQNKK